MIHPLDIVVQYTLHGSHRRDGTVSSNDPPLLLFLLILLLAGPFIFHGTVDGQGRHGDVLVTGTNGKVIALPGRGAAIEEGLAVNETLVSTAARGQTWFAQT